jgi:hypothetical protein
MDFCTTISYKKIRDDLLQTVTQAEKDGFDSVWADNNKQDTIAD